VGGGSQSPQDEIDVIKFMKLNEVFALDMQKNGLNAEPIEVGSCHSKKKTITTTSWVVLLELLQIEVVLN